MGYDEQLAARTRPLISRRRGFSEKKMFGGLGFLLDGHICVGVWKESLIVRVGPDQYEQALREFAVREFDITGRPMTGWVLVAPEALADPDDLRGWVRRGIDFVRTLPPK